MQRLSRLSLSLSEQWWAAMLQQQGAISSPFLLLSKLSCWDHLGTSSLSLSLPLLL